MLTLWMARKHMDIIYLLQEYFKQHEEKLYENVHIEYSFFAIIIIIIDYYCQCWVVLEK